MDDCLYRILSLLPKDQEGKYERGCKKDLADYLNLPHNIVAEWISGRNKSYLKYLYQIAQKYSVSVEWLKCEMDEKEPTPVFESGQIPKYELLSEENRSMIDGLIAKLLASQSDSQQ